MTADKPWADLASLDEPERIDAIRAQLTLLAEGAPELRDAGVERLLESEGTLESAARERLILGRFRAWLTMPAEAAQAIASSIETARQAMDGAAAMGDVAAHQQVARTLTPAEAATLLGRVPAMRAVLPESVVAAIDAPQAPAPGEAPTAATPKRPFWRFWAR